MREETHCHHMGYSYRLTARVLLYAPSHRQEDNTYHGLCYTSRGALAGTRNSSMGPPYEGSIRWPIAPWANALPLSYILLLQKVKTNTESNGGAICYEDFVSNRNTYLTDLRRQTWRDPELWTAHHSYQVELVNGLE